MNIHINSCILATILFVCLVAAQQQQSANQAASTQVSEPSVCNSTTTKPKPETKKYNFKPCIVAQFAAYISIGQDKYIELNDGQVDTNSSKCDNANGDSQKLVVNFTCASVEFNIGNLNGTKVYVRAINGMYKVDNSTVTFSNSTEMFSTTQSGHYYKCNTEQSVIMNKPNVTLVLSNFAYEAYRTASGTDFYQIPEECGLDSGPVSDLVRIGVGVSLVVLVAIVLIAYFIGRRRWSERSSYESV